MRVIPGNAQHIGDRLIQEDYFGFSSMQNRAFEDHAGVMMVLCDGMGGLRNGALASQAAVEAILSGYCRKEASEDIPRALTRAIREAHERVCALSGDSGDVGTTAVAAVVCRDHVFWASLGDSRLYLCRESGVARQLTADHNVASLLAERVARRETSELEAMSAPDREALTEYLGSPHRPHPHIGAGLPLQPGDSIVACTDGLYRSLSPEAIAQAVFRADPMKAAEHMIDLVLKQKLPQQDNLTVALFRIAPSSGEPDDIWERGRNLLSAAQTRLKLAGPIQMPRPEEMRIAIMGAIAGLATAALVAAILNLLGIMHFSALCQRSATVGSEASERGTGQATPSPVDGPSSTKAKPAPADPPASPKSAPPDAPSNSRDPAPSEKLSKPPNG